MIQFKTYTRQDAESDMNEWIDSQGESLPIVTRDFKKIREDIEKLYPDVSGARKDYFTDVEMGVNLYEYLNDQDWFNMRLASDDSFWRTLSVKIAPHLVAKRWGYNNIDHYYTKPRRIWFKAIWWFVYLSLDSRKIPQTRRLLESSNFTTDTIEAVVERPGADGFNVKLYRKIIEYYAKVEYAGHVSELFRSVMKLNTARVMVIDPVLYEGGIDGYVKALYTDLNAKIIG